MDSIRIILTHEQTDFDGIASILGAHIIDRSSVPVLPRRINRNVRAYLTIYGAELPFIDPRDLKGETISSVFLVDTQSLTSIKGMQQDISVHVIDHHALRSDLPKEWSTAIDETGANATVFVEAIQEQNIHLNSIYATLLLLGIYEDTGSLTYTRTTPRDIRSAAFLIEQGASLSIAADFLNHPLSISQKQLFDYLRSTAENIKINGQNIIIAVGDAVGLDEELSSIAHKLRDLLEPDAIFLLINLRGSVQLIARSTNDNIDVSLIARHFNGGGHQKAAAALIKKSELNLIKSELIEILPRFVQPAITVIEIMSRAPQVLSPTTSVHTAADRMRRFGYEGYPVVDDGVIIGLLTRRAVDRAISHKLNLTAGSLMEAGEVFVFPQDPIEHLQNIMTDTGWGQIPVVSQDDREIIGIVTRTDLLKILAPQTVPPNRKKQIDLLKNALPPARLSLLLAIAKIAEEQNSAVYIVGGFVRDLILGYPSQDFDLVIEGDAIALAKEIQDEFGGRVTSHSRFGTAKWFLEDHNMSILKRFAGSGYPANRDEAIGLPETLDLISARTEFYSHPTALPTVERGSIKLDLHRRDFTINTLALRLDGVHYGELHDYWGGYNDIKEGLVRVLHSLSFIDDPTRILRAVRYEQRYGFTIGRRALELLIEARPLIDRVSGDRIRHEIDNIFMEKHLTEMMMRLDKLGILRSIHPALVWDDWNSERVNQFNSQKETIGMLRDQDKKSSGLRLTIIYCLWFIRLPSKGTNESIKRLRLPRKLKSTILAARKLSANIPSLVGEKPSKLVAYLDNLPDLAVYAVHISLDDLNVKGKLENYFEKWRYLKARTTGHDLQAMNIPRGPIYKHLINKIRDAYIDGLISSNEEETALLKNLISSEYKNLHSPDKKSV